MRIEYDTTLAEIARVQLRMLERSGAIPGIRRRSTFTMWLLCLPIVFVFFSFLRPGDALVFRVLVAAACAAVGAAFIWLRQPRWTERSVREQVRQHFGGRLADDEPIPFAVELRPSGLWARQGATETLHDWRTVTAIEDGPDGVDAITDEGGFVRAGARGFASPEERAAFVARARELQAAARAAVADAD